jgi:hypothetical protein
MHAEHITVAELGGQGDRTFNWDGTGPLVPPAAPPLNVFIRGKVTRVLASREKYGVWFGSVERPFIENKE